MKSYLLIFLLSINFIYSQNNDWFQHEIDSLISISIPSNEVFIIDTIANNIKLHQIYNTIGKSTFVGQRTQDLNIINENLSTLPHNLESLKTFYNQVIKGITRTTPFKLKSKKFIFEDDFYQCKLKLVDSTNKKIYESQLILLNQYCYNITYLNQFDFNENEKEIFINSIKINKTIKTTQYKGKSLSYRIGYLTGEYFFIGIIMVVIVIVIIKNRLLN